MTLSRPFFVSLLLLSPALFTVACGGDDGGAATPAAGSGGAAGAGTAGAAGTSGEAGAGGRNAGAGGAGAAGAGGAGGAAGENTAGAAGAGAAGAGAAGGAGVAGGAGDAGGAGASGSAGAAGAAGADPLAVCEGIADLCVGYTNVFAWEGKETLVPEDMDTIDEVTALVAQGDKLVAYPGVKSPLGRIVFAGVPVGPYQLQFKRAGVNGARPYFRLIASSDRKLNLGRYYVGRPFADAMPKPALARLQAPFVTAWRSPVDALGDDTDAGIDQLYLYSYAAQYEGDIGVPKGGEEGTKAPVYGDASLDWTVNMASFPPSYYPHQRIDASKGDTTVVLQTYSERLFPADSDAAPDVAWQAGGKTTVAASYSSSTFTMAAGQTASLSGTFAVPPAVANTTFAVDFQASAFGAEWEATTVAPVELRSGSVALSVYAEPGMERVTGSPAPTLLYVTASSQLVPLEPNCYQAAPAGSCELPACVPCDPVLCGGECNNLKKRLLPGDWKTDFVFANPLANPSTLLGDLAVYYGLPGGKYTTYRSASLTISDTIANLTGKPLVPVLGFVHDLAIDGQAASWQEDERLLSATGSEVVEVKWQKPALGTARRYYVGVYAAVTGTTQAGDSVATGQLLAQVGTADTSAAFPRAALPTGVPMYLTVRARSADRDDEPGSPENNPAFGAASSTTVSAYFKL